MTADAQTTILVTGAAGGIGLALTQKLVAQGRHVVMLDINQKGLAAAAERFGAGVTTLHTDITDPASVAAAVEAVRAGRGGLLGLVNNAGIITPGPFAELSDEAVARQLEINLVAPVRVLKAFLPLISRPGRIVNVVSMAGVLPLRNSAAYTAGKFGLRGFALTLAQELRPEGVTVSCIYPSAVDTPMLRKEAASGGSPLNFLSEPLPPEKVADAIVKALRDGGMEYFVPYSDGLLSKLVLSMPWILPHIVPFFERQGEARHKRYVETHPPLPEG